MSSDLGAGDGTSVARENRLPGSPRAEWDVVGMGSPDLQGFATECSVDRGEDVHFKVSTTASAYRIDIYRLGWYGGSGGRKVATVEPHGPLPHRQPPPLVDGATGLCDCGTWTVSATWAVPADTVSGVHVAKLVRTDGVEGSSHIVFVVRDDASHSDLLFQTSDTTWQAYNAYGGRSLYRPNAARRAHKVSYNRPLDTRATAPASSFFNAEYPMVRWLEANGYDVTYRTGLDTARRGDLIRNHRVFLSVGQDEYWSAAQRSNVEAARDAGVHLAFFSGNATFWRTRWEPSISSPASTDRTLVSYKESHGDAVDPRGEWTGSWRDPRRPGGGEPENALKGTIFAVNGPRRDAIAVPSEDGKMRFWRNTSIASLERGQVATLPRGTLGFEWDEDLDNGHRPAGLVRLSSTTVRVPLKLSDAGVHYASGRATHHLTLHRAPSGALVFSAGTVQWSWGLDDEHDPPARGRSPRPDPRMQQATVNLLVDMGVRPHTLRPGMVVTEIPAQQGEAVAAVTWPGAGSVARVGRRTTVTGIAVNDGGVVGAVEVSVDDGTTWHPASGRTRWRYTWVPRRPGSATIRVRAADDLATLGPTSAPVHLVVREGTTVTFRGRGLRAPQPSPASGRRRWR